jgi:division protein CdvB (Snf7/Vps24/ESCRT-III family)
MPFAEKWEKKDQGPGFMSKFKVNIRPPTPLKVQIEQANRQIRMLITQLDAAVNRIKQRDAAIFRQVVHSLAQRDTQHAIVYANELSEVRKMGKMVTEAELALEQISLRLGTITDLGEIATTLAPAVSVIRNMQSTLQGVLPEADREIGEISGLLSSVLIDAGTTSGISLNFDAANEEALKVLNEASEVAEERMKEDFPAIPLNLNATRDSEELSA